MCHVLIIEDEPLFAMDLQDILAEEGATSFAFAMTEEEAVAAAAEERPDVITSDVKLLAGTGPHAISTICARLGPIPVIFITGTPGACEPCDPPGTVLSKPRQCERLEGGLPPHADLNLPDRDASFK